MQEQWSVESLLLVRSESPAQSTRVPSATCTFSNFSNVNELQLWFCFEAWDLVKWMALMDLMQSSQHVVSCKSWGGVQFVAALHDLSIDAKVADRMMDNKASFCQFWLSCQCGSTVFEVFCDTFSSSWCAFSLLSFPLCQLFLVGDGEVRKSDCLWEGRSCQKRGLPNHQRSWVDKVESKKLTVSRWNFVTSIWDESTWSWAGRFQRGDLFHLALPTTHEPRRGLKSRRSQLGSCFAWQAWNFFEEQINKSSAVDWHPSPTPPGGKGGKLEQMQSDATEGCSKPWWRCRNPYFTFHEILSIPWGKALGCLVKRTKGFEQRPIIRRADNQTIKDHGVTNSIATCCMPVDQKALEPFGGSWSSWPGSEMKSWSNFVTFLYPSWNFQTWHSLYSVIQILNALVYTLSQRINDFLNEKSVLPWHRCSARAFSWSWRDLALLATSTTPALSSRRAREPVIGQWCQHFVCGAAVRKRVICTYMAKIAAIRR